MTDMIWKELTDIDIVYHTDTGNTIKVDGTAYPKAYVVGHDDKQMMDVALSWAQTWRSSDPKIVTTKNDGFTFRIAKAANSSYRSGKLSFWMCVFEKEGIEPFVAGINSDLLYLLIMQSTLVRGSLGNTKVFFARCNGQLGVLHEQMDAYREFQEVRDKRKSLAQGKTTKWQVGYVYDTLTRRDVMLGEMVMPLQSVPKEAYAYKLDFDAKPMKLFAPEDSCMRNTYAMGMRIPHGDGPDQLDDFETCLMDALHSPQRKCPSRHCDGPASFDVDNYVQRRISTLKKVCAMARDHVSPTSGEDECWIDIAAHHIMLCEASPQIGLDALDKLEVIVDASAKRAKSTMANMTPFTRPMRLHCRYKMIHDGRTEEFAFQLDVARRCIELARAHYEGKI